MFYRQEPVPPTQLATTCSTQPLLEQNQLQRHEPPDPLNYAKLFALGRDDFSVADGPLEQQTIHLPGLKPDELESSLTVLSNHSRHIIAPPQYPCMTQLIDDFNPGLRQLMANGEYQRILQPHRSSTGE